MSKLILIVLLFILAVAAILGFYVFPRAGSCQSYQEAQCRQNFLCKPFYEYGISCGEGGCQEAERFKECLKKF